MAKQDADTAKEIKDSVKAKLISEYGYCGVTEDKNFMMLSSGQGNIVVKITWE